MVFLPKLFKLKQIDEGQTWAFDIEDMEDNIRITTDEKGKQPVISCATLPKLVERMTYPKFSMIGMVSLVCNIIYSILKIQIP